jgi:hypothetical protein
VAFGWRGGRLEPAERAEVEYGKDFRTYVRVKVPKKRRYAGDWVHEEEMPSGRLALRVYSAHWGGRSVSEGRPSYFKRPFQ